MSKMRFELNRAGVRELMKSPEMMAVLREYAESKRSLLGDAFKVSCYVGTNRANASVYTTDTEAMQDNLQNNTMLKAMGESTAARTGKQVQGYYRTGKNGKKVWVRSYRRRK